MLNEKKIHVMTKLSMMEKNKEQFEIKDYYMGDYIRFYLLKTIIRVTIGYLLILMLAAVYHAEALADSTVVFDYKGIGTYALLLYLFILFLYTIGSLARYHYKYKRAQRYVSKYEKGLGILRRFYQSDSEHKQGDK